MSLLSFNLLYANFKTSPFFFVLTLHSSTVAPLSKATLLVLSVQLLGTINIP